MFVENRTFKIALSIIVLSQFAFAQSSNPSRSNPNAGRMDNPNSVMVPSANATELEATNVQLRPMTEIRKETREKIRITDEEKNNYKRTLGDKRANIVRMIAAFSCSTALVIDISDPRCAENPDLATVSYYSFRMKDYGKSAFTDINLIEDEMTAGNKWQTMGFIADEGEAADFAKLDADEEDVETLWKLPTVSTFKEMTKQKADLETGITAGNLSITSKVKFQTGHTYILRTIAYRTGDYAAFNSGFNWYNTDSLFVVKIVGVDEKRTVTMLWKKIYQRIAPMLQQKEKEKQPSEQ